MVCNRATGVENSEGVWEGLRQFLFLYIDGVIGRLVNAML